MKKKLLTILVALTVAGVGVQTVRHYDQTQTTNAQSTLSAEQQQAEAVASAVAAAETKFAEERAALVQRYNDQRVECEKGAAAYERLTAYQKTQVDAPACGQIIIQ